MKRLDIDNPIASLLAAAGISQSELARRMDIAQQQIPKALGRGGKIGLDWLAKAAEAADLEIDIRLKKRPR